VGSLSRNRASGIPPENNALDVLVMLRRSKFEVIADILRLGQASRTTILHSSGIRVVLLDRYLSLLTEWEFLTITRKGNHRTYHTTEKGEILVTKDGQVLYDPGRGYLTPGAAAILAQYRKAKRTG